MNVLVGADFSCPQRGRSSSSGRSADSRTAAESAAIRSQPFECKTAFVVLGSSGAGPTVSSMDLSWAGSPARRSSAELGKGMIVGIADQPTHAELLAELEALRAENARLRGLLGLDARADDLAGMGWSPTLFAPQVAGEAKPVVDRASPRAAKVSLFRSLFGGREDVYALRWENSRSGKGGWGPAGVPPVLRTPTLRGRGVLSGRSPSAGALSG